MDANRQGDGLMLGPVRPVRPGELVDVRAVWWRQAALGHRLPPEPGIIVLHSTGSTA